MSYKILYKPELNRKFPPLKKTPSAIRWGVTILLAGILLLITSIPNASEELKAWLIPGDPVVTKTAYFNMMEGLDAGEPMAEAFANFCVEILKNENESH